MSCMLLGTFITFPPRPISSKGLNTQQHLIHLVMDSLTSQTTEKKEQKVTWNSTFGTGVTHWFQTTRSATRETTKVQ